LLSEYDGTAFQGDSDVASSLFAQPDVVDPHQILERTSDAVLTVDRDWRITFWNRAMAQFSGVDPDTMLGRTLWDVGHAVLGGPFPDALEAQYRHAMETGELVEFLQHVPEPVDHWIEVRLFADDKGLSIFMRDVTARETRRRALERQEFLFRRVQELSHIGVWELDLDTEALWWSSGIRRIHGVAPDYTPSLDAAISFYHPEDRVTIKTAVQQAIETGKRYSHRLRIIRPDGTMRHVLARGEVVYGGDGTPERLRGTFQDVTELERAKRELRAQNERLDMFSDVVAHDIRSPLTVAMGYTKLARETGDLTHLDNVHAAHNRIEELVGDLMILARSKLRAGDLEPTSLREAVQRAWSHVVINSARLVIDAPLGTVQGNLGLLMELFENLFHNAIEHGGADVTVRVGPLAADGFFVEDDGPGIPATRRDRVLEHGYSSNEAGTGLGLTIVTQIAAVHGWSTRVLAADAGGARFEFCGAAAPSTDPPPVKAAVD
jgi:PAS domain S-box-containing protein